MHQLIVPDVELARAAVTYWPESSGYQAKVMTCIALMETNGDRLASLVNGPESEMAYYADRGCWANNEGVVERLLGRLPDPRAYADVDTSARWARMIWDWRYEQAIKKAIKPAVVYAYNGWTTYRRAKSGLPEDAQYALAWSPRWQRAWAAVEAVRDGA